MWLRDSPDRPSCLPCPCPCPSSSSAAAAAAAASARERRHPWKQLWLRVQLPRRPSWPSSAEERATRCSLPTRRPKRRRGTLGPRRCRRSAVRPAPSISAGLRSRQPRRRRRLAPASRRARSCCVGRACYRELSSSRRRPGGVTPLPPALVAAALSAGTLASLVLGGRFEHGRSTWWRVTAEGRDGQTRWVRGGDAMVGGDRKWAAEPRATQRIIREEQCPPPQKRRW